MRNFCTSRINLDLAIMMKMLQVYTTAFVKIIKIIKIHQDKFKFISAASRVDNIPIKQSKIPVEKDYIRIQVSDCL